MLERKWCVMALVTDHVTGKLRESSVWSNVGKGCVTWAYVTMVNAANFESMTLIFLGGVAGHEVVSRLMNMKANNANEPKGN